MLKQLWLSYFNWYLKFSGLSRKTKASSLFYFRNKLFVSIFILTVVLGFFAYLASAIVAISLNKWLVVFIDTAGMLVLFFIFLNKKMGLTTKKRLFSINFFALSFALILELGFNSNGTIMLSMLCVFVTLYSGRKAGINTVLITATFYGLVLLISYFEWIIFNFNRNTPIEVIFIVFTNNIMFNFLMVFSVSFLIDQLNRALIKETNLQEKLIKKHKNVVKAKGEAERSNKLKTAFLANMSHEIRTPMYGILGCAELLKDYNIDSEFNEYVKVIQDNGNKLLDVISDIVNYSKLESGLLTANLAPFNIMHSVEDIVKEFTPIAKEKGVYLNLNNDIPKRNNIVVSDVEKFTTILKHLIANALKYTNKDGSILVNCVLDYESSIVKFSVEDTGIGISKDKLSDIFAPFYRIDHSNDDAIHGAGIGLAISKAYSNLLEGEIGVESIVDYGSVFWFTISTNLQSTEKAKALYLTK
ncbi:sensor histidine kinase [Neotamlana sedimentorum]|uniref:sensor histidine kinase n=1 Tax=Neotamlana sedimentorum TaxID=1435349 RepID=UPI00069BCE9E|nr:ATP-binding protein [Tamlana sedimentorum]